jgi:thymidylate synthase (FAD)
MKVLDHGEVRLVDSMGGDLSIARSARVSYDAAWRAGEDEKGDERLIKYLWKNGHNTPFESVYFTFFVQAPIFVFRQWHRHRTQSYNEVSARYTELPELYYVPNAAQMGVQSKDNKQMREMIPNPHALEARELIDAQCKHAFQTYKELLAKGIPRELARSVLPVNTYSKMFASMNLNNLFRFLGERLHPHAQYEIRVYAQEMLELARNIAPIAVGLFEEGLNEK